MGAAEAKQAILENRTALGIEFGSTRIKAVLVDGNNMPIASGGHEWENRYENGVWTYSLEDIWSGIQDCYQQMVKDVKEKYGIELTRVGAIGISAMMHGYMPFDKAGNLLVPFRTWRNNITGEASRKLSELFQYNTDDGLVPVPDLVGKTEAEAQELLASLNIGMSYKGEEASTQAKGNISSQDPVEGTRVEKNSTVNYYVSKGSEEITVPDLFGQNAAAAQETLESQGVNVQINKIYPDDTSSVDIGCVLDTEPTAGTTVKAGDTVTLTISRGIDYGDSVQVPDVTGLEKNEAIAKLGKFLNINVETQVSTDVAEGTVISQDPIGFTDDDPVYGNPDTDTITITVSSGTQDTSAAESTEDTTQTQSSSDAAAAAVANGEIWKCTQRLNTPTGYTGGLVRLELVQEVSGVPTASTVVDGQQLTFPYQLDIIGAPGVAEGTLYLSEQQSDGSYQELGHYPLTFEKAE